MADLIDALMVCALSAWLWVAFMVVSQSERNRKVMEKQVRQHDEIRARVLKHLTRLEEQRRERGEKTDG